jgi:hypothetical protein
VEDLISNWNLADTKPVKEKFPWTNQIMGRDFIAKRLDHFLVQDSFLDE